MILQRIPGERFSEVLPAWKGRVAVLLAGGSSLNAEQFELVRGAREADRVRVIAINDSYLLAPWADVHYAADAKWHRWHTAGIEKPALGLTAAEVRERWARFGGQKCTIQTTERAVPDAVHVLRNQTYPRLDYGLSLNPRELATGKHGGFQALNLAILARPSLILLLGYDYRTGPKGEVHWHGDHPTPSATSSYPEFRRAFTLAEREIEAAGVKVINCSPGSWLDSFEKMPLRHALETFA